jgi:prepilin-type N-terminal cleavage/methylation domain-containing protein/prepilin-type processing-associated H-X9-DG protein
MIARSHTRANRKTGFTLIELLVVVAIIAMLISILLPSLSKARSQARSTLCASRIGQLFKAMLLYANDYDETPPFLGMGYENLGTGLGGEYPSGSGMTRGDWAYLEEWLIPNIPIIWNLPEQDWLAATASRPKVSRLRNGTLFPYARFENLYRCPEFERVSDPAKSQNVFNYTRSVMGRKPLSGGIPGDGLEKKSDLAPGPIFKLSTIHAPGSMFMLIDEQWDFHVAGNYDGDPASGIIPLAGNTFWMGADPIHMIVADCFGDYHGVRGKDVPLNMIGASKKANVAYYDGHVDLVRDPLPGRVLEIDFNDILGNPQLIEDAKRLLSPFIRQIFASRGLGVDIMEVVSWFL